MGRTGRSSPLAAQALPMCPKWQMAGTKHARMVSETPQFLLSYLHYRGTLHGIDLGAPFLAVKVPWL